MASKFAPILAKLKSECGIWGHLLSSMRVVHWVFGLAIRNSFARLD